MKNIIKIEKIENEKWFDLILEQKIYGYAEEAYAEHVKQELPDYDFYPKKINLDFDELLELDPEQKTFFSKEKKGVSRPEGIHWHITENKMGESHFRRGTKINKQVSQQLGLTIADVSLNKQMPNNQVGEHIDLNRNLFCVFEPEATKDATLKQVRKYITFLEDWTIGQVFCLGRSALTDWKQGDVVEFPWYMPHYTANCSKKSRSILFTSGIVQA